MDFDDSIHTIDAKKLSFLLIYPDNFHLIQVDHPFFVLVDLNHFHNLLPKNNTGYHLKFIN